MKTLPLSISENHKFRKFKLIRLSRSFLCSMSDGFRRIWEVETLLLLIVGQLLITPVKLPQKGGKLPAFQKTAQKTPWNSSRPFRRHEVPKQSPNPTLQACKIREGSLHRLSGVVSAQGWKSEVSKRNFWTEISLWWCEIRKFWVQHLLEYRLPEGPTACFFRYRDGFGRFGLAQVAHFCCQVATFGVNLPRQVARITKIMLVGLHNYSPW